MLLRRYLVRLAATLTAVAAIACSSDPAAAPSAPPDPPGPPNSTTPASLSAHAGNGQTAQAGSALPINPAVMVLNAQSAPLSGVQVNFAVEAGGGSLEATSATTNAQGVASPGRWTLGPSAGPQRIGATVQNYSSIAKVTIDASAEVNVIVTQTVGTSGGTITVNRPGSPLNGATLQIGKDALGGTATITLLVSSTAGLTIPTGMQAVSPGLGIASSAGALSESALITLPATPVAGKVLMIAVGNPATGAITLLPTASSTATGVTALLPALDSRVVPAAPVGAMQGNVADDEEAGSIPFVIAINEELLQGDFDSDFRPGVDDWDFEPMVLAKLPFLETNAEDGLLGKYAVNTDGMVSTAIWYHVNRKKAAGGPKLWGSTQEASGQPLSSRRGIRWTALADGDVPSFNQVGSMAVLKWEDAVTEDNKRFAWLQFLSIKGLLLQTFKRPVPVVLLSVEDPDEFNAEAYPLGIAYRTEGNTVYITTPMEAGREIAVKFSEQGGMEPFDLRLKNGRLMNIRAIAGVHYVNVIDDAKLAAQWARVANGTIGDAEGWPKPELHWEKAQLDTAKVYLLDPLQHWWECAQCPDLVPRPDVLPETASHVQRAQFGRFTGNQIGGLTANAFASMRFGSSGETFVGDADTQRVGSVVWHPLARDVELGIAAGWLDWITTTYRKLKLVPSVEKITLSKDTTVTVTVTPAHAPPAGTKYRWVLRTQDGKDSVETAAPTHTRNLEGDADGWLIFSALEGEHKRPIARDSIRVEPGEPVPFWKLTTFIDVDELVDPPGEDAGQGGPLFDLLWGAESAPGSALIAISGNQLSMRVKRVGVWANCCPPPFGGDDHVWIWPTWSQSSTDLTSGTVTGVRTEGQSEFRIEATRNGKIMAGTMTLKVVQVDDETGEPDVSTYRMTFTAERMR